jgi:hypothetical protein
LPDGVQVVGATEQGEGGRQDRHPAATGQALGQEERPEREDREEEDEEDRRRRDRWNAEDTDRAGQQDVVAGSPV